MEESTRFTTAIKQELESRVEKKDPSHITMSSLGHCARQLAYRYHGVTPQALNWKSYMVFKDGDMHHDQLRNLLELRLRKEAKCYSLVDREKEVNYQGITGHIDGILRHDSSACSDPTHKTMLLEVKSMNDRAFCELRKTKKLGYEYACQVSGYLAALELRHAIIIAKNKNTGDLAEFTFEVAYDELARRIEIFSDIITCEDPEQIEREYGPNKAGNLPWQCGYCPFVDLCWRHEQVTMKKPHKYHVTLKKDNE